MVTWKNPIEPSLSVTVFFLQQHVGIKTTWLWSSCRARHTQGPPYMTRKGVYLKVLTRQNLFWRGKKVIFNGNKNLVFYFGLNLPLLLLTLSPNPFPFLPSPPPVTTLPSIFSPLLFQWEFKKERKGGECLFSNFQRPKKKFPVSFKLENSMNIFKVDSVFLSYQGTDFCSTFPLSYHHVSRSESGFQPFNGTLVHK